jgi:hypothetical protein
VAQTLRLAGLGRLPNIAIARNQQLGTAQPIHPEALLHLGRAAASWSSGGSPLRTTSPG